MLDSKLKCSQQVWESRLHNRRKRCKQGHRSLVRRFLRGDVSEHLSHFHLLARAYSELEVMRRLEHEHDRASETETAHLHSLGERLTIQDRGRARVDRLRERADRVVASLTDVGTERLEGP